jgi:membrane protease YdiL (CAAX protease family)
LNASARWVAAACVAGWALGACLAQRVGEWPALGSTAVVCGLLVVLGMGRALAPKLVPRLRDALLGILAGAIMVGGTRFLFAWIAPRAPSLFSDTKALYASFRTLPWAVSAALLVPVVLGEELAWRGAVQGALESRLGVKGAAVGAVLLYTAVHVLEGSTVMVLAALGCGIIWSCLRAYTGSLTASVLSHLLWDLVVLGMKPVA